MASMGPSSGRLQTRANLTDEVAEAAVVDDHIDHRDAPRSNADGEGLAMAPGDCEVAAPPRVAVEAALRPSEAMPAGSSEVRGHSFGGGAVDWEALLSSFRRTGFQASCLAQAVDLVNRMVTTWWPLIHQALPSSPMSCHACLSYSCSSLC